MRISESSIEPADPWRKTMDRLLVKALQTAYARRVWSVEMAIFSLEEACWARISVSCRRALSSLWNVAKSKCLVDSTAAQRKGDLLVPAHSSYSVDGSYLL